MKKNYVQLIIAILFATNVIAQNVPNYVPKNGLVGYWPFNGNANDDSGNGNHGTVNGATLTADRNGEANSAYSFDGIDNWINIPNNPNFDNLNEITISLWINIVSWCVPNVNGIEFFPMIVQYSSPPQTLYGNFGIQLTKSNSNYFYFNSNNYDLNQSEPNYWQINQWINLIVTSENNIGKWYLNGKNIETLNGVNFGSSLSGLDLMIGRQTSDINSLFSNGKIDDIAIYNRALTEQEITALYKGCTKETATSTSFNAYVFTNNAPINLSATPIGGTFSGDGIVNNAFNPTKGLLGKNTIKYNFKNTSGCADSTDFSMIMVDTLGNVCKKTINDTVSILKIHFQLTTGIKANTVTNISVYPNPTSDVLIIDATDSQALAGYTYRILDVQGKQIYNALVTSSKTEIALKTLGAKGVYVLHIVDANGISIENKKIVLQ